jgi:hypothetical protein
MEQIVPATLRQVVKIYCRGRPPPGLDHGDRQRTGPVGSGLASLCYRQQVIQDLEMQVNCNGGKEGSGQPEWQN